MKKILPLLLAYVLMTSQVFAISGGPVFGSGGLSPIGTYSGVIVVNKEFDNSFNNQGQIVSTTENDLPPALGLFSLGVPSTSVARGAALIFVSGVVYTGTITASVDPDSDKLSGIVNATYQYSIDEGDTTVQVTAQANGKITASISGSGPAARTSARLVGASTLQVANGGLTNGFNFVINSVLQCTVSGFRQSTTASTVTTL